MNGFGFIEYDDALDARDVVPGKLSIVKLQSSCANVAYLAFRMCNLRLVLSLREQFLII